MSQCEKTENQAEQNKGHAVGGIEAHPSAPHIGPPERIDEVDDSERKDNARAEKHENSCGQDALPILWAHHFSI